jgi:hypothetical protein
MASERAEKTVYLWPDEIGLSPIQRITGCRIVLSGRIPHNRAMSLLPHYNRLSPEEKLDVIRRLDPGGTWESLDSWRYCGVCNKLFSGRQIEVLGDGRHAEPLRLHCPTAECNSTPSDWRSSNSCQPAMDGEFSFIFEEDAGAAPSNAFYRDNGR